MISVDAKDCAGALAIASRAIIGSTTIPILSCARMSASGGVLRITATNFDLWVTAECPCDGEMSAVCPKLAKMLAAAKAIDIGRLEIEERPSGLFVKGPANRALLPLLPADEFPTAAEIEGGVTLRLDAAELQRAAAIVRRFLSNDQSLFYLNGAFLRPDLALFACNGHRAVKTMLAAEVDGDWPSGAVILPPAPLELSRAMAGPVEIAISNGGARFSSAGLSVTSLLIAPPYPDVDRTIPAADRAVAEFDKADLAAAVERVRWSSDDKIAWVGLRFSPGEPGLAWLDHGHAAEAALECAAESEIEIGFSAENLLAALSAASERLNLHCRDPRSPALLTAPDSDDLIIVMPASVSPYQPNRELADV